MYSDKITFRNYAQIFVMVSWCALSFVYNIDVYRNTFIGMGVFVSTFLIEVFIVGISTAVSWYACWPLQ